MIHCINDTIVFVKYCYYWFFVEIGSKGWFWSTSGLWFQDIFSSMHVSESQVSESSSWKVAQRWPWCRQIADKTRYHGTNIKLTYQTCVKFWLTMTSSFSHCYKLNVYHAQCYNIIRNNFYWSSSVMSSYSDRLLCANLLTIALLKKLVYYSLAYLKE